MSKNLSFEEKIAILREWIPLIYSVGGTPSVANRHLMVLSKAFEISTMGTFLPGRALLTVYCTPEMTLTLPVSWGFHISAFEQLELLIEDIESGAVALQAIPQRFEDIRKMPALYSPWVVIVAYGFLSATMAPAFFNGSWADGVITLPLGMFAGALVVLCNYYPSFNIMHEMTSSFVVSLLTLFAVCFIPLNIGNIESFSYWPIILASTIWILPGFSMVIGTIEMCYKFLTPGFIQHVGGLFIAFVMGLGYSASVVIFQRTYGPLTLMKTAVASEIPALWIKFLLCGLFSISCSVIYQSKPRQMILALASLMVCFSMQELGFPRGTSDEMISFGTALVVGLFVRLACKLVRQIPEASIYVAILPLVPGSRVVRSSFALLQSIHNMDVNDDFFKPFISSCNVCIMVAFGFVLAEIMTNKVIIPYMILPIVKAVTRRKPVIIQV